MTNRADLSRRIRTVRTMGRKPTDLVMSPRTWMEIVRGEQAPLLFEDIPVTLDVGALGIAIVFPTGIESA
jgi:hypothetical protein